MDHPYAPAGLELQGFVPLQLSQGEILVSYVSTSLFVVLAVWLVSGTHALSSCIDLLQTVPVIHYRGMEISVSKAERPYLVLSLFLLENCHREL
jgi:hypothetical protein